MPMLRVSLRAPLFVSGLFLLSSCHFNDRPAGGELSKSDFIQFGGEGCKSFSPSSLPTKICLKSAGSSPAGVERQRHYLSIGVGKWMGALKDLDATINNEVVFDCENPSLTAGVSFGNGVATAGCGFINLYEFEAVADTSKEDVVLQGTTLHELGHALAGLSDTYDTSSRQAGNCVPGQPESIMCWGGYGAKLDAEGWKTLYDDDIAGIRKAFADFKNGPSREASPSATSVPSAVATPLPTIVTVPTSTPIPYGTPSTYYYPVAT